jgi:O-antigen/teichoic acid export membrane protein
VSAFGAASRKYYDEISNEHLAVFVGACFQVIAITICIVLFLAYLFYENLKIFFGLSADLMIFAIVIAGINCLVQIRLTQWQVRNMASNFFWFLVMQSGVNLLLSLGFVVFIRWGVSGRITAQVFTAIFSGLIAIYLLKKDRLLKIFSWNKGYILEILNFGIPLIPHMCSAFLLGSIDRLIINENLGQDFLGIYMVAFQLASSVGLLFDAINKAYVPWLFEKLAKSLHSDSIRIVRGTYLWFCFLLILGLVGFFIGPLAISIIADSRYVAAEKVVGLLILGQIFGGMYYMVTNYIFYSKKTIHLSIISLFSGLLNVALLISFVPKYGLLGAGVSFALSSFSQFILTWISAIRLHPMPWFSKDILNS